jgi:hypothetical protein
MELLQAATTAETRQAATAAEPRKAATVTTATTATVVAVPSTPPAPAAAGSPRAVVVEVPDDDVPPHGWDQWASLPASAPEALTGALVVTDDSGAVASSSHDALPSSGSPAVRPEQEQERAGVPPAHFVEAQAEQGLWQEPRDHGASLNRALNEALRIHSGPAWRIFQVSWISLTLAVPPPALFRVRAFPDSFSSRLARWRQERQARERYDALYRLDADLHWYWGQYDALDALVEALRSPDRWLAYRAEALLDLPPEQDAQAATDTSAAERVRVALVERDDALRRAREDLAGARSVAEAWEAEVAAARTQLQQDRAALEGARAWQSQAEEKAREAEGLRTTLASKAAMLATAKEQLHQEGAAAETQLQREQAALTEARAALERERLAREEVLGQLQQERTALEGA